MLSSDPKADEGRGDNDAIDTKSEDFIAKQKKKASFGNEDDDDFEADDESFE